MTEGNAVAPQVVLRAVEPRDLPHFFAYQNDQEAAYMAAFTSREPSDRDAFDAHWDRIQKDPLNVCKTIDVGGVAVGNMLCFPLFGKISVGYWIGREFWGKGIATAALKTFLEELETRPLYAAAAADNAGSIRVLEKCGFVIYGSEMGYANARKEEIKEVLLRLD